ncbi:MAG: STAS domain-containing protein [Lachnospiraceae bacterium]|nr:STAS domain-containing protein [Lachnospiraceae bacterium]
MTIQTVEEGSILKLDVEGKIDTLTSKEFQDTVLNSFRKYSDVTVNLAEVTYISSAGLRAFLIGQKTAASKGGSFSIINADQSAMDVFKATGFDKVLDIR